MKIACMSLGATMDITGMIFIDLILAQTLGVKST
jgi:hypothetical protein